MSGLARAGAWSARLAALAFALGCDGPPRVSPWGDRGVPLGLYAEGADLPSRLAAIDEETRAAGLSLVRETAKAARGGEPFVVRVYEGRDRLGRPTTATRVASAYGVVLAVGPLGEREPRSEPCEALEAIAIAGEGALALPADLTGEGLPDVVLRAPDGSLAVVRLGPRGSAPAAVALPLAWSRLRRLDGGALALSGVVELGAGSTHDPAAPRAQLEAVAAWDGARFSGATPAARAFHARERERRAIAPEGESASARLARRIELAWHAMRATTDDGERRGEVEALASEPAEGTLREARDEAVRWLRARLEASG